MREQRRACQIRAPTVSGRVGQREEIIARERPKAHVDALTFDFGEDAIPLAVRERFTEARSRRPWRRRRLVSVGCGELWNRSGELWNRSDDGGRRSSRRLGDRRGWRFGDDGLALR